MIACCTLSRVLPTSLTKAAVVLAGKGQPVKLSEGTFLIFIDEMCFPLENYAKEGIHLQKMFTQLVF